MRRGEVWWVEFDERRPVVLLSGDAASGFQAMQIVPPSGVDLTGIGVEVPVGSIDAVPYEGVLRLAFPIRIFSSARGRPRSRPTR